MAPGFAKDPSLLCNNECGGDPLNLQFISDGECDDGGDGAVYSYCPFGADCGDRNGGVTDGEVETAFTFTNQMNAMHDTFFKAISTSSGVGGSYTAEIVESSCPAALGKGLLTLNATQVDDWADTILKQADYTATWADLGSTGTYSQMWRDPTHEIDSKLAFSAFPGRRLHSNDPHTGNGNYGGTDDAHSHSPSTGAHSTNGNAEVSFPKFSTKAGASWMLLKQQNKPTSTTPVGLCQFRSDESWEPVWDEVTGGVTGVKKDTR